MRGSTAQRLASRLHAGGGWPELATFCADHGLAPADPVRRAVFFLLTGAAAPLAGRADDIGLAAGCERPC